MQQVVRLLAFQGLECEGRAEWTKQAELVMQEKAEEWTKGPDSSLGRPMRALPLPQRAPWGAARSSKWDGQPTLGRTQRCLAMQQSGRHRGLTLRRGRIGATNRPALSASLHNPRKVASLFPTQNRMRMENSGDLVGGEAAAGVANAPTARSPACNKPKIACSALHAEWCGGDDLSCCFLVMPWCDVDWGRGGFDAGDADCARSRGNAA